MVTPKKARTTGFGTSGAPAATIGSIPTDITTSATKATNQGIAWRGPTNRSAPRGEVNAQRETAEEVSKPPRLHCSTKGSRRLMRSWLRRKSRYRAVRAKAAMLVAEASWYAKGIAADAHRPRAPYVPTHTKAALTYNTVESVSTSLRTRSSSESAGRTPTRASCPTQPGACRELERMAGAATDREYARRSREPSGPGWSIEHRQNR